MRTTGEQMPENSHEDLIDSLLATDHTGTTTHGEEQTSCPRHKINVWKYATCICRCALQGAPVEHIGYLYGSSVGVYIHHAKRQLNPILPQAERMSQQASDPNLLGYASSPNA
jgi:hypothetical protein